MKASEDYMVDRYGMERYRAIKELTEIMSQANGRDFNKYFMAKRIRAWIVPIGEKCWAPHDVFDNPILFVEQMLLKFQRECKGGNISRFKIKRKSYTKPYTLDNINFLKVDKNDDTVKRVVSPASVSATRN